MFCEYRVGEVKWANRGIQVIKANKVLREIRDPKAHLVHPGTLESKAHRVQ